MAFEMINFGIIGCVFVGEALNGWLGHNDSERRRFRGEGLISVISSKRSESRNLKNESISNQLYA